MVRREWNFPLSIRPRLTRRLIFPTAKQLVFAEDTCDALSWNSSATVYVTPPDAPVFAVFSLRETADDPSPKFYIRSAMLWHGSFLMNGRVHNVEIDDWRTTLTHLTRMLDTSFTALSPN